jgi:hypothetical protein
MTTLTQPPASSLPEQRRPDPPAPGPAESASKIIGYLKGERARAWLQRKAVVAWMNILIAAAAAVTAITAGFLPQQHWPDPQTWAVGALKLFALWCLAFLPGWLYVRFLGMRAKALWNEYVLNLHRLGWDRPWHLPKPPVNSEFYAQWAQPDTDTGSRRRQADNIYQQKFEAYYGRQIPSAAANGRLAGAEGQDRSSGQDYVVSSESLFPVFLATTVLAVGWAAVLWDTRFITAPAGAWDVLKYGFLGSYAFVTSMLIRRFFQSDLRPSAYASAVFRIMLVLLIVAVSHQLIGGTLPAGDHAELAAAFVIGFFPLVGLQALQRVTSKLLRRFVPPVTSEYPLDQLDGFNLWYEARLTEEGVEDMQNLTTMNLVDVILHTRVPVGRLVDWTDQAFLLIHLERTDRNELARTREQEQCPASAEASAARAAEPGAAARLSLRRVGIRTATDLLKAFSVELDQPCGALPQRRFVLPPDVQQLPLPEDQLRLLVRVLGSEPGLVPVWNWQRNGVPACRTGYQGDASRPAPGGRPRPGTSEAMSRPSRNG